MRRRLQSLGRIVTSLAAVAVVTAGYARLIPANPTTVALSYVVVILLIATGWGIVEATAASVVAMLCFNFFFLPPVGTLTIADPQNWVAFLAFLVTAIIASQLSGGPRQRELDASARQRDLERLYALSRALLLSERRRVDAGRDRAAHRRRLRAAERWRLRSAHGHARRGRDRGVARGRQRCFARSRGGR